MSRRDASGWGYQWRIEDLEPALLIGSGSPNDPSGPIAIDTWFHLVVRVSASTISFFRNGVFSGQTAVSGSRVNRAITTTLGGADLGSFHTFNGYLARAAIFERALSDDYIASDYALNSPGRWSVGAISSIGAPIGQVFSESLNLHFINHIDADERARFQETISFNAGFSLADEGAASTQGALNLGHIQDMSFTATAVVPPPPPPAPLVPLTGAHRRITIKGEDRSLSPRPSVKNTRVGE